MKNGQNPNNLTEMEEKTVQQSVIRGNLMTFSGYSPYCGNDIPKEEKGGCDMPRTSFNGSQFVCPKCGWVSSFPEDFIKRYKEHWKIK